MRPITRLLCWIFWNTPKWLASRLGYAHEDWCDLKRYTLFNRFGFAVYLHRFVDGTTTPAPHDHPRRFISIGLQGSYIDREYSFHKASQTGGIHERRFVAPWIRTFRAGYIHDIRDPVNCWTLVICLRKTQKWGFYTMDGTFIPNKQYQIPHDC